MFPTTVWTNIHLAGALDEQAMEAFAEAYRPAILEYIRSRRVEGSTAEDLCQDVFVRVLKGGVLAKADQHRGRFRSLLLTVTMRVLQDHWRKRKEHPTEHTDVASSDPEFDQGWTQYLTELAFDELRQQSPGYYDVLVGHLHGEKQDRNKLWIARLKLAAQIRRQVALTCACRADYEEELAYLSQFLTSPGKE